LIEQLQAGGVSDLAVLRAMEMTPRHRFVPSGVRHRAYDDTPLPIGQGQTISQPSIHARYLSLLRLTGSERVLEVGTGSGYQTALLARLAAQVFSIERVPALLDQARRILRECEIGNVSFLLGDGTIGWREYAPYDAILVSAGSPSIPNPLLDQLSPPAESNKYRGGRLLIPLGDRDEQTLVCVTRTASGLERSDIGQVRFVPLLGTHGWTT
jgi:protein-L-isoaspartate(D-aspartate) O-methyltransferase